MPFPYGCGKETSFLNGHPASSFDRRFVSLFLDELEQRDWPHYPDGHWFAALRRAADEFKHMGPMQVIKAPGTGNHALPKEVAGVPEGSAKQLFAHQYGSRSDLEWISAQVNTACTRFLVARGLNSSTVWATAASAGRQTSLF